MFVVFVNFFIVLTFAGRQLAAQQTNSQRYSGSEYFLRAYEAQTVKIGITLDKKKESRFLEKALEFTVQQINGQNQGVHFKPYFIYIDTEDVLEASRTVCKSIADGVTIQFLPEDTAVATDFQTACDRLDLPCMDISLRDSSFPASTIFSIEPDVHIVGSAVVDVMRHFGYNRSAAILDGSAGITQLDPVIVQGRSHNISVTIFYRNEESTYRTLLFHLRSLGFRTFVVAIDQTNIGLFVQNVAELNMHDNLYTYIFSDMDIWLSDLNQISHIGINLLAFSPLDVTNHVNPMKMSQMVNYAAARGVTIDSAAHNAEIVPVQAAVLHDSLHLIAKALESFRPLPREFYSPVSCSAASRWPFGSSIMNYLNTVGLDGLTGTITMQPSGRYQHTLRLLKLERNGLSDIGVWNSKTGLNIADRNPAKPFKTTAGTEDDPLRVVSILQAPFLMLKDESKAPPYGEITEKDVHGFLISLLNRVSRLIASEGKGFKYKLYLVPDREFGLRDKTGNWSGMVKEILEDRADLAVGPFTLTAQRESVISFTKPFMTAGIGILYQAPRGSAPNLFALMRSLSVNLWFASLVATAAIGVSLWIIGRFSPLEWSNEHFCTGFATTWAVNVFNLRNSLWFAMCSLMMQGCDINPRAVSTRLLGGVWWFYTMFLSAHFIAKLASVLTVEKMSVPFSSVDELVKHQEIRYGMLNHGSTFEFFQDSKIPIYKEMFEKMNASFPSVFVDSYDEGVKRVASEKYAFLMESTEIEYRVQRNCDVTQIGGTLNTIQYGIGTPKNSPWTEQISMAILYLIENSTIAELREQWWKRGSVCVKDEKSTGPSAINSTLVGGAFLILAGGLVIAMIMVVVEFVWNALHNAKIDKASLWTELVLELRHALRFTASSTRPVLQKQCRTCGVETHSLAAAQMHEHKDYTPMLFLDAATRHSHTGKH
ncbi:Glutamate receptor ionotropic, kainate 2 [Hypsibius exemplaris]|uniref:Glutamate receptor ionotropic, kainate 2 n=1 Tax=Hypsibius exemplaris TaxID=2072580 RepID=A0A1W0WL35_HYPEX|nr:Glutamate receptor ionotropic, kainate 2 [Hypsibius exemplaris]